MTPLEISYVIPCLNEEDTIARCVEECVATLRQYVSSGEVVVVDNGSTDRSVALAREAGARIVHAPQKGYGAALVTGFKEARGTYVFMADADMSYDFGAMPLFLEQVKKGNHDMIVGCRFERGGGTIEKNAMPWAHRYIGNPILSTFARVLFKVSIRDFHCGARLFNREKINAIPFTSAGMEFASEMIVRAYQHGLSVAELPVTLRKDMRKTHSSHLRPIPDALRHIKVLVRYRFNQ